MFVVTNLNVGPYPSFAEVFTDRGQITPEESDTDLLTDDSLNSRIGR